MDEHEWVQYQPYELENRNGKTGKEWLNGSDKPAYALMLDNCGSWGCGLFTVK